MSTIKGWVNEVWPGTFPEQGKLSPKAKPKAPEPPRQAVLTETEREILLSLNERKRQLDQRSLMLSQREEQLRTLRENIQTQVGELKKLQQEIEAGMEAKKSQDAKNLSKVIVLYNGMEPKKAAAKFETLQPKVAVQILLGMNQRKAAALLESLSPEVSKRLTEEIVAKKPIPR